MIDRLTIINYALDLLLYGVSDADRQTILNSTGLNFSVQVS
jgi:hypothetical protein